MSRQTSVTVEFFGVARARSGVACCEVNVDPSGIDLGGLLMLVSQRFPEFGSQCTHPVSDSQHRLQPAMIANVSGTRFVRSESEWIDAGESVLILSTDAGG
jgi:molybdopterin converting factor small subunit